MHPLSETLYLHKFELTSDIPLEVTSKKKITFPSEISKVLSIIATIKKFPLSAVVLNERGFKDSVLGIQTWLYSKKTDRLPSSVNSSGIY